MFGRLLTKIDDISFKDFLSYSFVLAILCAIPLSVYVSQQQTYKRAGAANESFPEIVIDEASIPYPNLPPTITDVQKQYGKIGDSVVILGKNFGDTQKDSFVTIGDTKLTKEEVPFWSDIQIEAIIPEAAQSGAVAVSVNERESKWSGMLTIIR